VLDFDEHIGSLLAGLVSLRLFAFKADDQCPAKDVLAFITIASDRAPNLEYFAMRYIKGRYCKRIGREWIICDKSEFPSLVFECVCFIHLTTTLLMIHEVYSPNDALSALYLDNAVGQPSRQCTRR